MSTLETQALSIGYARRTLAEDISFAVKPGEALAILGPNGSGKTTLFRTLLGLLRPRAGAVTLASCNIDALSPAEIARQIAYVPQAAAAFPHFSVIEIVEMARASHLAWYARPSARDRAVAEGALAELGIAGFADRAFAELSGGERQLVMIARALASEAAILMLDEPTASLDYGNQFLILDEIAKLKAGGVSILFTTHDPNQALRICNQPGDRTLTIARNGEVCIGATADILSCESLAALYGIPVHLFSGPNGAMNGVLAGTAGPKNG